MDNTYMKRRTACMLRPSSPWTTLPLATLAAHVIAASEQNSADAAFVRFAGIPPGTQPLTLTG